MSGSRGKVFPGDQLLVSLVQFISSISYYFNLLDFISSALVSFRGSLLLCNHCDRSFSSWLTTGSIVPSFLAGNRRLISSAKWWIIDFKKAPTVHKE